jgi:hypothetical protein
MPSFTSGPLLSYECIPVLRHLMQRRHDRRCGAVTLVLLVTTALAACSGSAPRDPAPDGSPGSNRYLDGPSGDAGAVARDGTTGGFATPSDGAPSESDAMSADGSAAGDVGASYPADRFVTAVVSIDRTECTGFGASSLPGIVEGPPVGGGTAHGSTDVVSLGSGGSIVVSFAPNAIVDGPGDDFIVFENPFWVGGNASDIYAEPGEVSVSDDGVHWTAFPCNPTPDTQSAYGMGVAPPYGQCAGWHVVYSTPQDGVSPFDPTTAGGDAFDLADIGVTRAQYVRIVDKTNEDCPESGGGPDTNGFDLDAIAIVNAAN